MFSEGPVTPLHMHSSRSSTASPAETDDNDGLPEITFEWNYVDGLLVPRNDKRAPRTSTPPTPLDPTDKPYKPASHLQPLFGDSPDPTSSPFKRRSLARSESAYPVLNGHSEDREKPRSLQRTSSGQILTSASSSSPLESQFRRKAGVRGAEEDPYALQIYPEEKENIIRASNTSQAPDIYDSGYDRNASPTNGPAARRSMPHPTPSSSAPSLRSLSESLQKAKGSVLRGSRLVKSVGAKYSIPRIAEADGAVSDAAKTDVEDYPHRPSVELSDPLHQEQHAASSSQAPSRVQRSGSTSGAAANPLSLSQSNGARPRRSASLSDALAVVDGHQSTGNEDRQRRPSSREQQIPGSNIRDYIANGPRRSDERDGHDGYSMSEHRPKPSESDRHITMKAEPSKSSSPVPPHLAAQSRPSHRRRDSDTLRNGSPTVMNEPRVMTARRSPTNKSMPAGVAAGNAKHRRSPTAPDPPTTSKALSPSEVEPAAPNAKTWQSGDRDSGEGINDQERVQEHEAAAAKREQAKTPSPEDQPLGHQGSPGDGHGSMQVVPALGVVDKRTHIFVNRKAYVRLDLLGKGGSSRVYKVMSWANELFAIKRVSLDKTDKETMEGYKNEIALLKRLDGNSRIIRLFDSEVRPGPNNGKGWLYLVMECGEIDLSTLLSSRANEGVDMVWIGYYWQQMLQAVHVIHEEKIVHSDLKPANFVLVKGQLKLIDFGIANAIANDTTNIQRDHQIGTVNYMSPEAIELPDGMRRLKVGRPSDIWSLGCILYQMVYGSPPFQHLNVVQKMRAIPDGTYMIDYPEYSAPSPHRTQPGTAEVPAGPDKLKWRVRTDVIASMKSCLRRHPKQRMSIPDLLEQDWLTMREPDPNSRPSEATTPSPKDLLAPDETIINPYYMRQLLEYGMRLGREGTTMTSEALLKEGERLVTELRAVQSQQS